MIRLKAMLWSRAPTIVPPTIVPLAGYRGRLRDYRLPKDRILFWPQTLYRSDGAVVINLVLYWARGHREPWYLATSLTNPRWAVPMYRRRMQPEQYFKDGKQRFGLNRSTVTTTDRLQPLLVGLLLACCLLILMGMRASPAFRRQLCSLGKLGILNLGNEYYLATPDPPDPPFRHSPPPNRVRVRSTASPMPLEPPTP